MEKFLVSCRELRISASRKSCWRPQVQTNWSSAGPGGKQVECILRAIAIFKNKGVIGDHVVFSFVSRRIQPLQCRKHTAFRYEGTKDPTRLSLEVMAHSVVVRRCCKVLDNFDKSLKLPALFSAASPPENTWVNIEKHYRVLVDMHFDLLMNPCFLCRRIIRHGTACLQLWKRLHLLTTIRNGKRLQDLCSREKHTDPIVASKKLFSIRLNLASFCLVLNLACTGSNIFLRMKKIKSKTSVIGCRMTQNQLLDRPPSH